HSPVASQKIIGPKDVSGGTFTQTDWNKISGALGYNVAAREVQAEIRKFDGASGATVTGSSALGYTCLIYTSDAAVVFSCVVFSNRRI
ncbi:hypothetical protein BT094_11625, partial [Corynebacterium diphtheriae]